MPGADAVHALRTLFWAVILAQLSGCTTAALRVDERAASLGYRRLVVQGDGYSHVAYLKEGLSAPGMALHVYLEGDGTPWMRRRVAASDPTPRTPLMLDLMSLDPAPSLYLGRPCYHGLNREQACTPDMWTDKRYSRAVVASMAAALVRLSADYPALILLGHSGGGTLAMLMAEHLPKTEAVITVAANLDIARWAGLHRQPPLTGSLNPVERPPLPQRVRQTHYAGGRDGNVPPMLVRDAIARQQGAGFIVFSNQGHGCCWRDVWPVILRRLAEAKS